jgi:hypothetical protein
LERSRRRRELAEDARKTISRRRQASLAVSAAMATTPVVPSVIAGAMTGNGNDPHSTRTLPPDNGQRILLKLGAVSPSVGQLQRRLEIPDDGYFGPVTEAAVKKFQRQHNLVVTGMVDVKTWLKLFPDGMVIYKPNSGVAQMASHVPEGLLRKASAQTGEAGIQSASLFTPDAGAAGKGGVANAGKAGKKGKGLDSLGSGKGSKHAKAGAGSSGSNGSGSPASRSAGSSSGSSSGSSGSVGVKPGGSTVVPKGPFKSASEMIAAMIAKANEIDSHHYAYSWGGGHNPSFSGPYDCSGAVSAVLHAAGLLKAPMVSGDFAHWGAPGRGAVTLYANAGHVYMSILGHYFGTTSMNPGGGAGWFEGAPRPGFVVVHVPFESMNLSKAQLKRLVAAAERRDRKRRRHQGLSAASTGTTYQPVTPGYSGQAPGGTYSSNGGYTPPPDPAPAPEPAPAPQSDTNSSSVGDSSSQVQAASTDTTYDASGTANGGSSDSYSSGGAPADGSSSNAGSTGDASSGETSAASVDSGSSDGSSNGSVGSSQSDGSSGDTNASSTSSDGSSGSGSSGSDSSSGSGSGSGDSGSSSSGSGDSGSSGSGSADSSSSGATNAASSDASSAGSSAGSEVSGAQSAAPAAPAAPSAPAGGDSGGGAVPTGQ